jgi:hypothetical protein
MFRFQQATGPIDQVSQLSAVKNPLMMNLRGTNIGAVDAFTRGSGRGADVGAPPDAA